MTLSTGILQPSNPWLPRIFQGIFILSLAGFGLYAGFHPGTDFRGYYGAALLVRHGGNPYEYAQLAPVLEEVSGFQGNNPYFYPPWYCLFFVPLTLAFMLIIKSLPGLRLSMRTFVLILLALSILIQFWAKLQFQAYLILLAIAACFSISICSLPMPNTLSKSTTA